MPAVRVLVVASGTMAQAGMAALVESVDGLEVAAAVDARTAREIEVLRLLPLGLTNQQVARRLGISEHTAKFHVSAVLGKLGVQSRAEAVTRAFQRGLISV